MLRFFRSIRQNLLQENKSVQYLKYAVGEIILIMIGIFLALQLDNWNDRRLDRIEEQEILDRICVELKLNISDMSWMLEIPASRKTQLDRIADAFEGAPIMDKQAFLEDVGNAAGWDQPTLIRSTYEELLSSGKIGLIQNIDLRNKIARFYDDINQWEKRASLRVTDFVKLANELLPIVAVGSGATQRKLPEGLGEDKYEELVNMVLESDLRRLIQPTRNRADFLTLMWSTIQGNAQELLVEIETELNQ